MSLNVNDITVLGDKLLICPTKVETKTASGLLLPNNRDSFTGVISGVGPNVKDANLVPGKKVMFNANMATKIDLEDSDQNYVLLLRESDIWAIIQK